LKMMLLATVDTINPYSVLMLKSVKAEEVTVQSNGWIKIRKAEKGTSVIPSHRPIFVS
jgi:hypothetical protein